MQQDVIKSEREIETLIDIIKKESEKPKIDSCTDEEYFGYAWNFKAQENLLKFMRARGPIGRKN